MPLRTCPQCEGPLHGGTSYCEHCGFPLPVESTSSAMLHPNASETRDRAGDSAPKRQRESSAGGQVEESQKPSVLGVTSPIVKVEQSNRFSKELPTEGSGMTHDPLEGYRETYVESPSDHLSPPQLPPVPNLSKKVAQGNESDDAYLWKLVVVEGFSAGKQYLVYKETLVLGRRDEENGFFPDIDLEDQDDGYISRRHAILRQQGDGLWVEDLGGENGTFVDHQRLPPHQNTRLQPGKVMRLGRVGLLVKAMLPPGREALL